MPPPTFIEGQQLVQLLRGPDKASICMLDVRDEDYRGGHVAGCLNVWSDKFHEDDSVDAVIRKHNLSGYRRIVVTCMMSQQRGPFCARRLASRLDAGDGGQQPEVNVLYGGMRRFLQAYGDDPALVHGRDT